MSGPKHSEWQVLENARLEAARRRDALLEIARLQNSFSKALQTLRQDRADDAARIAADATQNLKQPAENAPADRLEAFSATLRTLVEEVNGRASRLAMSRHLNAEIAALAEASCDELDRTARSIVFREGQELAARRQLVQALVKRAPLEVSEADLSPFRLMADELMTCPARRAAILEMEMRAELQMLQRKAAARSEAVAEAAALRARLWGFDGVEVERLRHRLEQVETERQPLSADLRAATVEAAHRLKLEADRRYAAEVLRDEFEALGYEVGADFVTAFQEGGDTRIRHPRQGPYLVELHFAPEEPGLDAELVVVEARSLSASERARRDCAAEERWCGDLAQAFAGAEARSVRNRVRRRVPVGQSLVREATDLKPASTLRKRVGAGLARRQEP